MEQLIFLSSGSPFSTNIMVIVGSLIIIISYLFNLVAKRYSIPSVLLLIVLGLALHGLVAGTGVEPPDLTPILEVLGTVGLIMIVLEASLDLELTGEKRKLISNAFFTALISLILTSLLISGVIILYLKVDLTTGLLYAVPLSIMSSAIIIPSIGSLNKEQQEFMIYESTFSDILGIMLFYFLISSLEASSFGEMSLSALLNLSLTVLVSVVASYFLIFLFQKIRTELKLFLLIAVLILLYSISKIFHLSSLLIILVFGMILSNRQLFFPGKMRKYLDEQHLKNIFVNFKMITLETSFVVRTFFFVIFGFTILLATLLDLKVWLVALAALIAIFGIRFLWFWIFFRKHIFPNVWLAPRGLITILLFYSIPETLVVPEFNQGILLLVILISSIAMAFALIRQRKLGSTGPDSQVTEQIVEQGIGRETGQAIEQELEDLPADDNKSGLAE